MVYRLALEAPEMITASASIAANLPAEDNSDCQDSHTPVSMAILNGTGGPYQSVSGRNRSEIRVRKSGRRAVRLRQCAVLCQSCG